MRTRVFIFNNASRAANYGIGTYVRQLSEGLVALTDVEVAFVEMFANTKEFNVTTDEQGKLHYQIPSLSSGMESEAYCRSIFYFIARNIEADDDDNLVFQFNYFQHRPLAALLKGKYPYGRIILTVHYFNWCFELKGNVSHMRKIVAKEHEANDDMERRVKSSFTDEKVFLHLADEVIALSRATKEIIVKDYEVSADKIHLVYNGIGNRPCNRQYSSGCQNDVRRNILYVGRLDEIKGVKYLISAFEKIVCKHPDTHLVVAGDGDFQPYLVQGRTMQGHISFLGKMQSDELEEVYQSAYIGVMPSFHEQCSYTAIEMMRHGIPVIGTDSTGLAEMLDATPQLRIHIDEENFSEEGFVSQIASRMDLLLSDDTAYYLASNAVFKQYQERYVLEAMIQGVQNVVQVLQINPLSIVSSDYLPHMDKRMIALINEHPDIDAKFFGMAGIGIYLWWRVLQLGKDVVANANQLAMIEEHLVYYIDWVGEVIADEPLEEELCAMLASMKEHGFCSTLVGRIWGHGRIACVDMRFPSEQEILHNALKICTCKI